MAGKTDTKTSRCWPGYEPVPGKSEHEEGSCRKKPASRNGGVEVDRERSRHKQIAMGGKRAEQAKSKSPDASERSSVSKTAQKKAASKRTASKSAKAAPTKQTANKKTATKRAASKKTSARSVAKKSSKSKS